MKRKVLLSLVTLLIWEIAQVNAQVNIEFTKKLENAVNGQDITSKAIIGSVVVVKQSYQVKNKKNGKIYGRNGKKNFGQGFSIGVKTEAGLVLTDEALKPWISDNAFKKVEQNYEPIISLTEIRAVEEKIQADFSQCPLHIGSPQPQGLWIAKAGDVSPYAMEIDTEEGGKAGWLIWYTTEKSLTNDPKEVIGIQAVSKRIELVPDITEFDIDVPSTDKIVLGAIYISPTYLGGGHISYKLVGMAVNTEGQWKLRTPFVGFAYSKANHVQETGQNGSQPKEQQPAEEQQKDENVELTPISKEKKKK